MIKSPGFYGTEIYRHLGEVDSSFKNDIPENKFLEDIQDERYASQIYSYLTKIDRSFPKDMSLDEFIAAVKKKEEVDTVSAGGDTSSVLSENEELSPEASGLLNISLEAKGDSARAEIADINRKIRLAEVAKVTEGVTEAEAEQRAKELEELRKAQEDVPMVQDLGDIMTEDENGYPVYTDQLLEDLRLAYGKHGFRFEGSVVDGVGDIRVLSDHFGEPRSFNLMVRRGMNGGLIPPEDKAALQEFLNENRAPDTTAISEDERSKTEKALRAQEIRPVARKNRDGSVSSHLMAYGEVDGKFVAYPTLFPNRPNSSSTNPSLWREYQGDRALDEAIRRGETFTFDTEEEAAEFAAGSWKDTETIDLEGERLYNEQGRDYYIEQQKVREMDALSNEYSFIEQFSPGDEFEGDIPPEYQKFFVNGNTVRSDIDEVRNEIEGKADYLYETLNAEDNVRLREDFDVILGKKQKANAARASEINQAARIQQDELQIESLEKFGVRVGDLLEYQPQTQEQLDDMNYIIGKFNASITDRMLAAKAYEKAELYYSKKHNKQVTDDYVDGFATWFLEWDKAIDRGNAMSLLLKTNLGMYNEEDDEYVSAAVSRLLDEDDARLSRKKTRVNETATSGQYWSSLARDPASYTIAIMAESMGQLLPLGAQIVPYFAATGAVTGAIGGLSGGPYGAIGGAVVGAVTGAAKAVFLYGMPLSEFALEMGNSIIDEGNERGYDWADPQQALLAFSNDELWKAGTQRGVRRGVPISLASYFSNAMAGRVFTTSAIAPLRTRAALGVAERVIVDPAFEMAGEFAALVSEGKYTGSVSDMREIVAEGLGAIGQSTPMYAINIATERFKNGNFELAMSLVDPKVLAEEKVDGKRIVEWTNNAENLGQITPDIANFIRKNVGYRREANEILGRKPNARPGFKAKKVARLMELLEAKESLTRSASVREVFKKRIAEINEEIAYIAENNALPESPIVDLSLVNERTQRGKPAGYKIGKKAYTRAAFVAELEKRNRFQLRNAKVIGDPTVARLLKAKQDAVQKQSTTKVPPRDEPGAGPTVGEEVQDFSEASEEDIQAEEEGQLDTARKERLLSEIARKLNKQQPLTTVEQTLYENNKDEIDGYQKEDGTRVSGLRDEIKEAEEIIPPGEITPEEEVTPEEEPTVEEEVTPEVEPTVEEEVTPEEEPTTVEEVAPERTEATIRSEIARILGITSGDAQIGVKSRYKRERAKINRRKPSEAREAALKELDAKEAAELADMSQRYRIARNALSVLEGKGIMKVAREGTKTRKPLTREEIQQIADLAGVDVETLIEAEPEATPEEEAAPEATPEAEPTVEEEVTPEPTVEEQPTVEEKPKTYKQKLAEMTAEERNTELQRRNNLAKEAKKELDELKGKNDKPSRQRRKDLKAFMDNLNTMLVDEALALRVEELQEQVEPTVEEDPFIAAFEAPYKAIEEASTMEEIYAELWAFRKKYKGQQQGEFGLNAKKVFEALSKNQNLTQVHRLIAQSLTSKLDDSVKISGNGRLRVQGYYYFDWDGYRGKSAERRPGKVTMSRIELANPKRFTDFNRFIETMLHEGVHAVTYIDYVGGNGVFTAEMDRITSLVKKYIKNLSDEELKQKYPLLHMHIKRGKRAYRMNPEEIMAWGLTNTEMQNLLKAIPDPKGGKVWSSLMDAIRNLLGLEGETATALDSLMRAYEGSTSYEIGAEVDPNRAAGGSSAMVSASYIGITDELYRAAIYYGLNENGFIPNNALQKDVNAFKALLEQNGLTLAKAKNGGQYVAIKGTRVPYDLYAAYEIQMEELEREKEEIRLEEEAAQAKREIEERIREIYEADERPYRESDFDGLGSAMISPDDVSSMNDPSDTIADIVAKGRALGFRDAAIRALLVNRFGKENIDTINTVMTEYFDPNTAIPEAFGNVVGGIDVGRQIYDEVRTKLNEFLQPKPGRAKRMTKQERTDRIKFLRNAFPEDKALNDTQLLRKHPRNKKSILLPPSLSQARAEAANLLTQNELFKQQPLQVQQELLVAFDKTFATRANRQVQSRISQIKRDLRKRKEGARNLKKIQNELRALIREVLPKSGYSASEVNSLINTVVNTNDKNIIEQASKVLELVEKQRNKMRERTIKDMVRFVKKSKTTYRTKSGRIRTRTLDAPGQAYFEAMLPILKAIAQNDVEAIERIAQELENSEDLLFAIEKQKSGGRLTSKEQRILDRAAAFDLLSGLTEKSLEDVEAIFEDLRISAGFSRVALKNTRLARAAAYQKIDDEASASLSEEFPFLTNPDGSAMDKNQISAMRTRINAQLRSGQYNQIVEGVKDYMKIWVSTNVGKPLFQLTRMLRSLGTISNKISPYLYDKVYNAINRMDEQYQVGAFEQKDKLDEIANSVDGISNGYRSIVSILYDNQTTTLKIKNKESQAYDNTFNKDQLLRVYALSLNEVQRAKLEAMGFTPEVMEEVKEFLGPQLVEFADKMVDYLSNEYYETINDVYVSVNDINLPHVQNYFPTRTVTGEVQQELLSSADFSRIFDAETSPALKDRTDTRSDVDLSHNLSFSQVLGNHIETMERYKAYAEGTKQINYLFKNKHLDAVLEALHLNQFYREMVNQAINPNAERNNSMRFALLDKLLSRFSRAVLGFKIFQIPKQLSSFITAFQEYQYNTENRIPVIDPVIDRLAFMAEYAGILPAVMIDLGRILNGSTPKGPVAEAVGVSKTFARRLEQFRTGNIYTLESGVETFRSLSQQENTVGRGIRTFKQAQAAPIMIGDAGAIMAYLVTYRRNIKNGMDPDLALQQFNDYNITQQSRRPGDRVPLQYAGNAITRTYIMFGSSIIGLTNNAIVGWQNIMRDVKKGNKPKSSDVRRVWLSMFAANILFTLIANSAIFLLSDDDEEKKRAIQDALLAPLNGFFMIPVLGGVAEGIMKEKLYGYRYTGDGSVDVLGRTWTQMDRERRKGNNTAALLKGAEILFGTNFDPFIGLYNIVAGNGTQEDTYEALGIPKTQRPD